MNEQRYRNLTTAEEVDRYISDDDLDSAIDWFDEQRTMPADEFFDRLFPRYSSLSDETGAILELDNMDNYAARRILSRARALRKARDL